MQTKHTRQNVANTHKPYLLDHINFFPSKEEGRIPGERKALSERKAKRVNTVSKESYLCHSCEGKVCYFLFFFTRENCVERGGVHIDLSSTRFWSRPRRETRCPNNDSNFNLQRQLEQLHSEHNMPKTCQRPTIFALRNV